MTEKQKIFIKELAATSKKGLDSINEIDKFIKTKMSYCFSAMEFLCDNYDKVYGSAQSYEKFLLDGIGIEDLLREKNILDCTFQLEKNFSLTKVSSEQMLETITKGSNTLTFDDYYNLCDYTYNAYEKLYEELGKLHKKYETVNAEFFEILEDFGEDIILLTKNNINDVDVNDIIVIKDFCLKSETIKDLYKNFMEAGDFVLSSEEELERC